MQQKCKASYRGDVLDGKLLSTIDRQHTFSKIFHLAGLLSTAGEKDPEAAHDVNVNGAFNILNLVRAQSNRLGRAVIVMFPSTIAAYGIPDLAEKEAAGAITELQYLEPITIYGANKLYTEQLGRYYSEHYNLLGPNDNDVKIDFRCIRLPGVVSAETLPTGGTSDYCPEMLHAAARGEPYASFVRPNATIPFMVMADAVKALLQLSETAVQNLTRRTYNVSSFSLSAGEIREEILKFFPDAQITFKPGLKRQSIVDSWPKDIDDSRARKDWGWKPDYGKFAAFDQYLVPRICARYENMTKTCANA